MSCWKSVILWFRKRNNESLQASITEHCQAIKALTLGPKHGQNMHSTRSPRGVTKNKEVIKSESEEDIELPSFVKASLIEKCPVMPTCPTMLTRENTADKLTRVMIKFDSL